MNPSFPVYIVSKGRADSRVTVRYLDALRVPYRVVVEAQEHDAYAAVIDPAKLLVLDPAYQDRYDTFDNLGTTKGKGPGPARNFAWAHSMSEGAPYHWVMDDNIQGFYRLRRNTIIQVADGTMFKCMEDFVQRYTNIGMAGPNYEMFVPRRKDLPPYVLNTRIYSCNLIRNDVPFRWRGRYNEDTDLSLRLLKAGYCTVQFNAFLQKKTGTQRLPGGNTAEFYAKEGTAPKSRMLLAMHPDVTVLKWRFGRCHHLVNYRPFQRNHLKLREGVELPQQPDEYGMQLMPYEKA
ncbi:hypothetical protein B0G84_3284 [Paraburkholderia sp. BL8N3]|nr:hypothetical protein [Paraburkholderia sp. BL8N3]TCK37983.1 hypothetical protein B0G84_3284 [Paraburkholderia sp. BL8N3]